MREIRVELDLSPAEPIVLGNAIQLEQVFVNLLTNARDAVANAAERTISVSSTGNGDMAEVIVRDTGPGIPEGLEQRIFDPFFTTKEVGAGTGLGLSITYSIIQEHEANIVVASKPDQGAIFRVQFPLLPKEALAAQS
jgi:two-component system C4-dicarboxylate transport sensor histidine kinase DctB